MRVTITDLFGGILSLGAGYNPMSGANFGLSFSKQFNQGGRVGFADGPEDPSKRKFMKIMGGLASLPIVGRFFDIAQVAEKAAPAVVETFKNAPPHFVGLVNKIRALGKIINPEKLMPSDQKRYSNVYDYGDYRMYEGKDGQIEIAKDRFMATDYGDAKVSEEYMSYNPKSPKIKKGELTGETEPQYDEYTAYSDQDGKMKDVYEGIEESTKMDGMYSKEELEQLIIEQSRTKILKRVRSKCIQKGKKSGPPPKSGPMPQGLNLSYNTVKTIKLTEKINGNRQSASKRAKKRI